MEESLDEVEAAVARGDVAVAVLLLVPILEERRSDRVCAVAARVMTQGPFAPEAMAGAVDRLVALVREQEGQIEALRAMVETAL